MNFNEDEKLAFYVDMTQCTGCKACMIACTDKHHLPTGLQWRKVIEASGGDWNEEPNGAWTQNVFSYYISLSCNHCEEPLCARSCPTGACAKTASHGIVAIDKNRCVGCGYCRLNCPYSSPQLNKERGYMTKCDMCMDYLAAGLMPSCVSACPSRVLEIGNRDELIAKYGMANIAPLPPCTMTSPSLALKPHRLAKPVGSKEVHFANKEEV